MAELQYWLALAALPGMKPMEMAKAVVTWGGPRAAWERLARTKSINLDPETILASVTKAGCRVLTWADEEYPEGLFRLEQPPPVLYLKGERLPSWDKAVAIVGTRSADRPGERFTERLAGDLSEYEVATVSGMARGIDAAAHRGALKGGGVTVAVLGSGIDVVYPPEHGPLFDRIATQGTVVSEYPPGCKPAQEHFPWRNRVIAGLCGAVVVVQAGKRSGALITARYAVQTCSQLLVVPGDPDRARSVGSNRLLRDGAQPALDVHDVICALGWKNVRRRRARAGPEMPVGNNMASAGEPHTVLSESEGRVYSVLSKEPMSADSVAAHAGVSVRTACAALLMLEIKGLVEVLPGPLYTREC